MIPQPAWSQHYATVQKAECDLSFVFQGNGWYKTDGSPDTMLVTTTTEGGLVISVWHFDPRGAIKHILGYPDRKIDR